MLASDQVEVCLETREKAGELVIRDTWQQIVIDRVMVGISVNSRENSCRIPRSNLTSLGKVGQRLGGGEHMEVGTVSTTTALAWSYLVSLVTNIDRVCGLGDILQGGDQSFHLVHVMNEIIVFQTKQFYD